MNNFGYYAFTDPQSDGFKKCSRASEERPLIVNCAGCFSARFPFITENPDGRPDHYLIYVTSGHLDFSVGDLEISATEGCLALIPSHTAYKYSYGGGEELVYLWIHFTGSEADSRLEQFGIAPLPQINRLRNENRMPQRFQTLFDAFGADDAYRDIELSALMERLLISAARSLEGSPSAGLVSYSARYISSHYTEDIRIPDLASMEHLSVSRYCFLFKRRFGVSPQKYILELRISTAKELLTSTDLPIKEIGSACGYADPHFFSRIFCKSCGVSPTEYRREIREK